MKSITIKNAPMNISTQQQKELQELGFKQANYMAPWVYKATDNYDLVSVAEDLELSNITKSLQWEVKF